MKRYVICARPAFILLGILSLCFSAAWSQVQMTVPELVEKVTPSVVFIEAFPHEDSVQRGTGFIISETGDIITNYHVIHLCHAAQITLSNGEVWKVKGIIAKDEEADLVRLSLADADTTFEPLPLSDSVKVGEDVVVIGHPFGKFGWSVSRGSLSAIRSAVRSGTRLLQHDAAVYRGSSGSPVLNLGGEVIGAQASTYYSTDVHHAIPSDVDIAIATDIHFAIAASEIRNLKPAELVTLPEEKAARDTLWAEAPEGHHYLGKALYSASKYEEALPHLREAVKLKKDPVLYGMIGYCLERSERIEEAVQNYELATVIKPEYWEPWYRLAHIYYDQDRYQEAAHAFEQARLIKPDHLVTLFHMAKVYLSKSLNRPAQAIKLLRDAVKVAPDSCFVHVELGNAYLSQRRFEQAEQAFELAVALDSRDTTACWYKAYNLLADVTDSLIGEGKRRFRRMWLYKIAPLDYKELMPIQTYEVFRPEHITGCSLVAVLRLIDGMNQESKEHYERALANYKEAIEICSLVYVPGYKHLVGLFCKLGRYQEAAEILKDGIEIREDCLGFGWAYYRLVIMCSVLELDSESEEFLAKMEFATEKACAGLSVSRFALYPVDGWKPQIPPDTAFKCCALGIAYETRGHYEAAVHLHSQAINIHPHFAEAHFLLGRACVNQGDYASALKELKELKDLNDFLADKLLDLIYPP